MKNFIFSILYFVLPIFILAYPLDLLLSFNLKQSNTFANKEFSVWNDIFDGKVDANIIICGSSRAWVHINPTMLGDSLHSKAYNFGIDGHNFWLQYLRYQTFLKYNPKPELIIYSVDIYTLQKRENLYNGDQFLPYILWDKDIDDAIKSYRGYSYYDSKIPLVRYTGKYQAIRESINLLLKGNEKKVGRVRGYEGQDTEWNLDFDNAKKEVQEIIVKFDTASINLFEDFINDCRTENIELVFVYTPEYIEGQRLVKNRDDVFKYYNYFSKKYMIPFYDFSNDSICLSEKYFYNASHLNKSGSELFTIKLIDSLKVQTDCKGLPKWEH